MGLSDCECGGFIALGPDASNKCDKCGDGVFSHAHKPCTWAEDSDGVWNASCPPVGDHSFCFTEDGPTENGFKFCPYCGKPLVASAFDPNAD